jgi:hypothetical protein
MEVEYLLGCDDFSVNLVAMLGFGYFSVNEWAELN